jgi:iron complex transport system ATP-binding protein
VKPVLEAQSVSVRRSGRLILDTVTLGVAPSTLTAVVGPNGSGKSTLLRVMAGLWRPSAGAVLLDEIPLEKFRSRELARRISFVPQDTRIDFSFTVREVVGMGRYAHRRRFTRESREDQAAIEAALDRCDVAHLADYPANVLSGGERQRVLIARSLAATPGVIILDEPTASLDIEHALDVLRLCRELASEKRAVLLATHDLDAAAYHADAVEVLDRGHWVANGPPRDVLNPDSVRRVFGVHGEIVHAANGAPHLIFQMDTFRCALPRHPSAER